MKRYYIFLLLITNILALQQVANASQIDTIDIYSPSMHKNTRCVVITPANYNFQGNPYPVLYLLHGWSGNYAGWLSDAPQIAQHADTYNMIIVCPDGGYDSWYLDSPVDSTVRYETFIAKELTAYIDYYYHAKKNKSGRAIAGLSMGGHGALYLAARNQEVFGAAGSMCGGLDLRPFKRNDWDLEGVLGSVLTKWQNWEQHSVINVVPLLEGKGVPIMIDCGLGDFFLPVNRATHQVLMDLKIPHEYIERPGEHNDAYWGGAVDYQILFFDKFFRSK